LAEKELIPHQKICSTSVQVKIHLPRTKGEEGEGRKVKKKKWREGVGTRRGQAIFTLYVLIQTGGEIRVYGNTAEHGARP